MRKYEQDDYRHEVECILDKADTLLNTADELRRMPQGMMLGDRDHAYWLRQHQAENCISAAMAAFEEAGDLIVKVEGLAHE